MELSTRQWEIILQGLVSRRDLISRSLDVPQGIFYGAGRDCPEVKIARLTRGHCQEAIDLICQEHPEARELYFSDVEWDTPPLKRNY